MPVLCPQAAVVQLEMTNEVRTMDEENQPRKKISSEGYIRVSWQEDETQNRETAVVDILRSSTERRGAKPTTRLWNSESFLLTYDVSDSDRSRSKLGEVFAHH